MRGRPPVTRPRTGKPMEATLTDKTWVLAEFETGEALTAACRDMRKQGFLDLDIHSPYPLLDGDEALGLGRAFIPKIAFMGAVSGMVSGFGLQLFSNFIDFPINVAGRPSFNIPTYVPITFEATVLGCALSIFFGLLAMFKLPQPYHPAFELEDFRSATTHGFWLTLPGAPIRPADTAVDALKALHAKQVQVVVEDQR